MGLLIWGCFKKKKKAELTETESRMVVARENWGEGKGDYSQQGQTSSYKMNTFWESNIQHVDYS